KFYGEWTDQSEFKWVEIDSLHKILGKEIRNSNVKLDEISILKKINNPLANLLIKELSIKDTSEYEDLLIDIPKIKSLNIKLQYLL
ncbi:MAG: hypothetical protein L3J56_04560, partial [Bacteroidales bacterium]|nr:hypothetical protein [Bacteroidales bacterium]